MSDLTGIGQLTHIEKLKLGFLMYVRKLDFLKLSNSSYGLPALKSLWIRQLYVEDIDASEAFHPLLEEVHFQECWVRPIIDPVTKVESLNLSKKIKKMGMLSNAFPDMGVFREYKQLESLAVYYALTYMTFH